LALIFPLVRRRIDRSNFIAFALDPRNRRWIARIA
jgi:hypothetical protein